MSFLFQITFFEVCVFFPLILISSLLFIYRNSYDLVISRLMFFGFTFFFVSLFKGFHHLECIRNKECNRDPHLHFFCKQLVIESRAIYYVIIPSPT